MINYYSALKTTSDATAKDPVTAAMHDIGIVSTIMPILNKINSLDPGASTQLINLMGKDTFVSLLDRLTSNDPVTMKSAFELVSGASTHGTTGGKMPKAAGYVEPRANPVKQKAAAKLLSNYNSASRLAAGLKASS